MIEKKIGTFLFIYIYYFVIERNIYADSARKLYININFRYYFMQITYEQTYLFINNKFQNLFINNKFQNLLIYK